MANVLVVNAGSTSLKLSLVDSAEVSLPVPSLAAVPADVDAVAHRVVHGGARFLEPVLVDDAVEAALTDLAELAPLHNGPALVAIRAAREALPAVPHVAVFDTAFHATLPPEASTYALPRRWRDEWGIRRYGFHGLSVQWAAGCVPVPRLVVCHLGGGCSVTGVLDGRSVETTMGFSPLEGVPMATRSGSVDAAAVLHLLRQAKLAPEEVEASLERESGLFGLSGISSRVEELERSDDPAARLALAVFCYRIATAIGSMVVALGGLDALVFTAGVGERSARVRGDVCARLAGLGVELEPHLNDAGLDASSPSASIARPESVPVIVLLAREDVVAARAARDLLGLGDQLSLSRSPGGSSDSSISGGRAHE